MAWVVGLPSPFYYYNQLNSTTWDQYPDNNATLNCGETCLTMILKHLREVYIPPDTIKDAILSDNATGTSTPAMLEKFLSLSCNFSLTTYQPTEASNSQNTGALNIIWRYLDQAKPLISLGQLDYNGTLYPHWRVVTQLTDTDISLADPWYGANLTETRDAYWTHFKGYLLGIEASRPSGL